MISSPQLDALLTSGGHAVDPDGNTIGELSTTIIDSPDRRALWVAVKVGLLGRHETFLPIDNGTIQGDNIHVTYVKEMVTDAPHNPARDGRLSPHLRGQLITHYGLHEDSTEPKL